MKAALVLVIMTAVIGGCSNDPKPRAIHIAYEFRLEDDRDSLSTELKEGAYEVRLDGDCSDEDLVFTQGGVFDDDHNMDDLVHDGLRVRKTSKWRIRQYDGHRMSGCRGVVLYPDGVKPPPGRSIIDAVDAANVHVEGVSDDEVEDLIRALCKSSDADALAAEVMGLGVESSTDVEEVVQGIGDGSEVLCPDVAADDPQLVSDTYSATLSLLAAARTTTTARPTTTTAAPTTTSPPTTSPPPTSPPPTSPPPTSPPPTSPPPTAGVYYANCDEARAAGAAPLYRGEPGYRSGLDRDHDGVACE